MKEKVIITQIKGVSDRANYQRRTLLALGLGKINRSVEKAYNPQIQGMVLSVNHLVKYIIIKH
ncbi:MAG: 50S ribosomal protein L30 [Chitinophagaceae bacterium]|nr:50S ribosomal protein L30 [Chitinophagaceae bacterium]